MKTQKNKKNIAVYTGFTLIELLIAIAIVAILAAIVASSLTSVRSRGRNTAIIATLSSLKPQADLGKKLNGDYLNNICNATTGAGEIGSLLVEARNRLSTNDVDCYDDDTDDSSTTVLPKEWRVEADFGDNGNYFCSDSTGIAKEVLTSNTNSSDYTCN